MSTILLDYNNNASPPHGFKVIDTEVAFLENATSGAALFVKGQRLCRWAKGFYEGRNIQCQEAQSPIDNLITLFPSLTMEQALFIIDRMGENVSLVEKWSAAEILGECFSTHIWTSIPSKKHAAEWLLWFDETVPQEAFFPILRNITDGWKQMLPEFAELYNIRDAIEARNILKEWLAGQITPLIYKLEEFPLPVPERWFNLLDQFWRKEIVRSGGTFISDFLRIPVSWQSKQQVALASLDYFEKNPNSPSFTDERFNQIARFISSNDRIRLIAMKPVAEPNNVPETPEDVLLWFEKQYLPFRQWQVIAKASAAYPRVLELGLQFARWYLDFYPQALNSKKYISFFKSKNIKNQDSNHVDLLVILDGLHALDAKIVLNTLLKANGTQRLTLSENSFCFAPLPTVTDFTKGALVRGVQPTLMKQMDLLGEDTSERQTPLPKLQSAKPGSLFIWRIQEPDSTYHTLNNSPLLQTEVEGELKKIAQKIIDIIEKLSPHILLRITITTDHGRFLGVSDRNVDIPFGLQAHGRAAWGQTDIRYDKTGYKIEGDLVYLSKDRFGLLGDDAAVILTDSAFRHERYNQEISTHGGLFPEEVIIPWIVLERNMTEPELEITLSGNGRANFPGIVQIAVLNPSSIEVTLVKTEFNFGESNQVFKFENKLPALEKTDLEISIPIWPSSEQLTLGSATAILRLPSGEEFTLPISLSKLHVTELYTRDKSLLEGLDL